VAALTGVERRNAYQAMDSRLSLKVAVRIIPVDRKGYTLDPSLLTGQVVDDLGLKFLPLGPAEVHAQEHIGPILGLGTAGAGMDGYNGIAGVILPPEHALEFCGLNLLLDPRHFGRNFAQGLFIIFLPGQLEVSFGVFYFRPQVFPKAQIRLKGSPFLEQSLGTFVIVPEIRFEDFLLDLLKPGSFGFQVKDDLEGPEFWRREERSYLVLRSTR